MYVCVCAHARLVPQSCPTICDLIAQHATLSMGIPQARILEWVAMPSSRGSSTQGWNPGLLYCRQIIYHLSHRGSPRIVEWVAYPFSRGTFQPGN